MSHITYYKLLEASWETIYMVLLATVLASLIGIPIAIILYLTRPKGLYQKTWVYQFLSAVVNGGRSIPFIIMLILLLPLTRILVRTSIGPIAAIVPLCVTAIPFIAKVIQNVLEEIPIGLIEAGLAMGASTWQMIRRIMLPEALPGIVNALTVTAVTLVGYATMAGAITGGGLGELAINYGYQRFDMGVMVITVLLLIALVQIMQFCGDTIARSLQHA